MNQATTAVPYNLCLLATGSLYVGMYLYINGMADDLFATLKQLDRVKVGDMWQIYVNEIRFHNSIIEYDVKYFLYQSEILSKN